MNRFFINASTLAGTWMCLATGATAQVPALQENVASRVRLTATEMQALNAHEEHDTRQVVPILTTDDRYSRVHWDTDAQETIWVRGRGYKASFNADGATYFPLFGGEQPRHFPMVMSLASATSDGTAIALEPNAGTVREGDNVVVERGAIDEVYAIGLGGIEQTFVVEAKPQGELKLFVSIETELAGSQGADGFEFSNEFGTVGYGLAFARESDGRKHPLMTRLVPGGIQIDIPADYLATAEFPMVIDPVIFTFFVDLSGATHDESHVAYDLSTNRYLFIYKEFVGPSDGDVYSRLTDANGNVLAGGYVDISTERWLGISVANLNAYDQFLVVGSSNANVSSSGVIQGRITSATTLAYGAKFTIAAAITSGIYNVSVGGDPYPFAPSYYCVSWIQYINGANNDVHARLVTNLGTLTGAGPIIVESSALNSDREISVSHSNASTRWNLAWNGPGGIRGAQIEWNGGLTTPSFGITNSTVDSYPQAATCFTNGDYMVVWERDFVADHDIMGALITGGTVNSLLSLTGLEPAGSLFHDQRFPRIDCDGEQFVVGYWETSPGLNAYVSSFHVLGGSVGVTESKANVGMTSTSYPGEVYAQNSSGGSSRRYAVAVDTQSPHDITGAFYDLPVGGPITPLCFGDGSGAACPCANPGSAGRGCGNSTNASGAQLSGAGQADYTNDTVVLTANGVSPGAPCLFFQGTALYAGGAGIVFGDGLVCAGGSINRLAVKFASGTSATFPGLGDVLVLSVAGAVPAAGGVRFYQAWYRDSAVFCSSLTYNLTNGVKVSWLP